MTSAAGSTAWACGARRWPGRALAVLLLAAVLGPGCAGGPGDDAYRRAEELFEAGRYAEAAALYRESLDVRERELGPDHPAVGDSLRDLAFLLAELGRPDEAAPLAERALAIYERAYGARGGNTAVALNTLGRVYRKQGRYDAAEAVFRRALAIAEAVHGPSHPVVATALEGLSGVTEMQGDPAEAERLRRRALAITEAELGADHPDFASSLNDLALEIIFQGRYAEAAGLLERAVAIEERTLGADHPGRAITLGNLAVMYRLLDRDADALATARRATAILRGGLGRALAGRSALRLSRRQPGADAYDMHLGYLLDADPPPAEAFAEAFEVAQLARASDTARAVARMAARFAAGSDPLARLVREREETLAAWREKDAALLAAAGRAPAARDRAQEAALRSERDAQAARLDMLERRLAAEFPDYAELVAPRPVPVTEVQQALRPEEALVLFKVARDETNVLAVRPEGTALHVARGLGREALADAVVELRAGLDPSGAGVRTLADIPAFDVAAAHALYARLLGPLEPFLAGTRHLMVVPDGPLQSLPLGVLVTAPPDRPVTNLADYAQVAWLARVYALTTLPAVSSLKALRAFAGRAPAGVPFTGFGDPALDGKPGAGARGVSLASLFRDGEALADVNRVRLLPPLPETADELRELAAAVGGSADRLYLAEAATETAVKTTDLTASRIVAFATHALVAGELAGTAEPALVLSPPAVATAADDGLLTASEVAKLRLNADLVILSACNTAAGDGTPGAEGLTGLAKAFVYAGSRTLLVSHWPVFSSAAVRLTTGMLEAAAADPGASRAEALRRAMAAMMDGPDAPYQVHPMFWAPFVVVGEGGAPLLR